MSSIDGCQENIPDKMQQIIKKLLSFPTDARFYYVSQEVASTYPQKALLETSDDAFGAENFASAGHCTMLQKGNYHNHIETRWYDGYDRLYHMILNGYREVEWQGKQIGLLLISWQQRYCRTMYYWILADTKEDAENFFSAVCEWNTQITDDDEILVFEHGRWSKDTAMSKAIKTANFDNLILGGTLKEDIQNDIITFFASSERYEELGLDWKSGTLDRNLRHFRGNKIPEPLLWLCRKK